MRITVNAYPARLNQVCESKCEESVKDMMVFYSHTIVDPGTVMVKSVHAFRANVAVSASGRSDNFTIRAQAVRLKLFK